MGNLQNTRCSSRRSLKSDSAFTLFEMLATLSIFGILSYFAVQNLKGFISPVENATDETFAFYKLVRSKAITNTRAYRLAPSSSSVLATSYRDKCTNTTQGWTNDPSAQLYLPTNSSVVNTTWSICLDSRGFPDDNLIFQLQDIDGKVKSIEIYLGGGIKES